MTDADPARRRWYAIVAARVAATIGIVIGLMLLMRGADWSVRGLGVAVVLAAFYFLAVVPRALAARWRSDR